MPDSDVWGYADLHCHPMSHLGFGGVQRGKQLFWGSPSGAPQDALACCSGSHSGWHSLLPFLIESGHGDKGHAQYSDWPQHDTIIHQQMYVDWIKRAYNSGLRLMCALAVNNELLPHLFHGGYSSQNGDKFAIESQLREMKRFARQNASWMRVVYTAAQARRAIDDGRMAVVLGVEVDRIGGWLRPGEVTDQRIRSFVDGLHRIGVRMMTPIHLTNNALGGCAVTRDTFNILNHFVHGRRSGSGSRWYEIDAQATRARARQVEFLLGRDPDERLLRNAYGHAYPAYELKAGHVNRRGLSPRGKTWIRRMMNRGMLIDVDHMSDRSRDQVLDVAEQHAYPVLSSHSSFRDLGLTRSQAREHAGRKLRGVRHEGMLDRDTVKRVKALGGMMAPITRQGPIGEYRHPNRPYFRVYDHAQDTSHSWAHAYLYGLELMGSDGSVAIGTDFNGLAEQPRPRFVGNGRVGAPRRVRYGRDTMVQTQRVLRKHAMPGGRRTYDFNTDGLSHYGLLPDFLRDIARQYDSEDPLVPFYRSAQRFIEMWERCEANGAQA